MTLIGTLKISNHEELILSRGKLNTVLLLLGFSKMKATKMVSLVSELSRQILETSVDFVLKVSLLTNPTPILQLQFIFKKIIVIERRGLFENFFDNVIENEAKDYGLQKVILEKKAAQVDQMLSKENIKTAQEEINKLTESQLLAKLEEKNLELLRAYEKLKTSQEELLNRTQELANLGGWEIDLSDMSVEWTDQVSRIHELSLDARPNVEKGIAFYAPEARPVITKAVNRAIEKGIPYDLELPFITAKGNHRWVRAIGYPEKEGEKVVKLSGLFQDITTKKMAEFELQQKNDALKFKNKELEQFVYIASHDLQEPLRTISSFVDILDQNYNAQFDEVGKKSIQFMKDAAERMSERIKGLLYYSRIGKSDHLGEIDTNKVVQTVLDDLSVAISESKAKVHIKKLPKIYGYQDDIRLLFQNLISNALKYSKKDAVPEIWISCKINRNHWEFSVKDNGIGIAEENQERIFEIFQRLHTRNDFEGTGIGLSHCIKIVQLHEGKIWVASKPNLGSTFYFSISKRKK